uniref:Glycosyltransferase family 92 protein n=1 Tax=Meloidogyne floridensis TaxID=298350 RepID=A0A915NRP7_9BILA
MSKNIGRRPIVLGAFHRLKEEQNVEGDYAVIQFLGDGRQTHTLFCISENNNGEKLITRAHIERIHKGKRAANDLCSWSGHLAELTTNGNILSTTDLSNLKERSIAVQLEEPLYFNGGRKYPLVVCIAPMYTYTDWQIMLMGIESWIALGAQKIIFPIQSASADTVLILKEYERIGIVHLRKWPKWPLLSDVNPNGLVLSRGIEESHVNCLHFVKAFAEMVVFTDIDDM